MVKALFEILEHSCVLNKISLHLGRDLLVETELLNDQVEVIHESLLHVFSDIVVQNRLYVEGLVRFLNFLDPHVELVQLFLDEVIEVVCGVENIVD